MAVLSVRLPDDLGKRFDAAAAASGGRSARVRRLIEADLGDTPVMAGAPRGPRSAARLMVRLAAHEAWHVEAQARALGLARATWVAALVRRHAGGRLTFSRTETVDLSAIQTELRRIGVNINQIARALNTAVLEGRVLDLELGGLAAFQREIRGHMTRTRGLMAGRQAYWDIEDE